MKKNRVAEKDPGKIRINMVYVASAFCYDVPERVLHSDDEGLTYKQRDALAKAVGKIIQEGRGEEHSERFEDFMVQTVVKDPDRRAFFALNGSGVGLTVRVKDYDAKRYGAKGVEVPPHARFLYFKFSSDVDNSQALDKVVERINKVVYK